MLKIDDTMEELRKLLANPARIQIKNDLCESCICGRTARERLSLHRLSSTFLTSGARGVLDFASGIKYAAPTPNMFGITSSAAAVAIPL